MGADVNTTHQPYRMNRFQVRTLGGDKKPRRQEEYLGSGAEEKKKRQCVTSIDPAIRITHTSIQTSFIHTRATTDGSAYFTNA